MFNINFNLIAADNFLYFGLLRTTARVVPMDCANIFISFQRTFKQSTGLFSSAKPTALVRIPCLKSHKEKQGIANATPCFLDGEQGIFRRTAVRLRIASLFNHGLSNSPPDCFHRQSRPSLFESLAVLSTKNNGTVFTTPYRYSLAESKGFEPSKPFWRFTRFPIVLLRPARTTLRVTCDIIYDCLKKIKCELQ